MKKYLIIAGIAAAGLSITGCGGGEGEDTGRAYMPDMYYSRAYEAYGYNNIDDYEKLKKKGVFYNGLPVAGTMARGDVASYTLPATDSGYAMAVSLRNPKVYTVKPVHGFVASRSNWALRQMAFLEKDPDVQAVIR